MPLAICTHNLTKRFPEPGHLIGLPSRLVHQRETLAVDQVAIRIHKGEVFGLVGPNGAGKTTLVKMLATLILPSSGTAQIDGYELCPVNERRIKSSIGLVTGNERSFYPRLSCRENLQFYAGLHDLSPSQAKRRINELSQLLDLGDFLDKRYQTCSTGMKHRLALARSLLNAPALLFLDEPTRSLDPLAACRFREAVYALAHRDDRTVFLVTHDLDEAAELCDRVGVMLRGRLRVVDTPRDLRRVLQPSETCRLQLRGHTPALVDALGAVEGLSQLKEAERTAAGVTSLELRLEDRERAMPAVLRTIGESGATVEELTFEAASWDEVFERLCFDQDQGPILPRLAPKDTAGQGGSHGKEQIRLADGARDLHLTLSGLLPTLRKPLLFLQRDLKTQMRYRLSFLLQSLGILFSSASFYFVAQLLGPNTAPQLARYGGDYFSFVLIGIAFVGYQGVALNAFSGVIRSAQSLGTLEALLVTPTRLSTILISSSLWSFAFTSVRVIFYLVIGMLVFGADLSQANLLAGLVILLLTVLTLSSIGILSACFIMVFKRGSPLNFLIGSLSSLMGGVYYPIEVLPSWLQAPARLFPLTYALEAMRRALLRGETVVTLSQEIGVLTAFAVVLLPLGLVAFHYAVRQAKRDGSLTHF